MSTISLVGVLLGFLIIRAEATSLLTARGGSKAEESIRKRSRQQQQQRRQLSSSASLPRKEDYHVKDLPYLPADLNLAPQYAGYVPVDGAVNGTTKDGHLFFWLHESQAKADDPLVIWLNGGPGCSSLLGMLLECGPFQLDTSSKPTSGGEEGNVKLVGNPYAWNVAQHLLFVEQPVETGFAFSKDHSLVDDESDLSMDFYGFLRNFFLIFPEKAKNGLYIFGESYAGMYAPSIAKQIHDQNQETENQAALINLKGIAIGNGWVDQFIQTASYPVYAYNHGLIDLQGKKWLEQEWNTCLSKLNRRTAGAGDIEACQILSKTLELAGNPNEFDVSTFDSYDGLMDDGSPLSVFLNDARVQEAIHVKGRSLPGVDKRDRAALPSTTGKQHRSWSVCNDAIMMPGDKPLSTVPFLADLLQHDYRVLLYNGETDLSCNFLGTESYLGSMEWRGEKEWQAAPRAVWRTASPLSAIAAASATTTTSKLEEQVEGEEVGNATSIAPGIVAGYHRSAQNLEFLVILNSGHLVPMNQPERALDLVYRFTRGISFSDAALPMPWLQGRPTDVSNDDDPDTLEAPGETVERLKDHGNIHEFLIGFLGFSALALMGSGLYAGFQRHKARMLYQTVGSQEEGLSQS